MPGVVSIHKFSAGRADKEQLAQAIAAFVDDTASTIRGLTRATVLSEYGGSHITVIAEWETHEAWTGNGAALYANQRLRELLARMTGAGGTNEAYIPVGVTPHGP